MCYFNIIFLIALTIMQRTEYAFSEAITKQILINVAVQWVQDFDTIFFQQHTFEEIAATVEQLYGVFIRLFDSLGFPCHYLAISVFYADKFVKNNGMKHTQMFNLLFTRYTPSKNSINLDNATINSFVIFLTLIPVLTTKLINAVFLVH
jgi:hypothetical protein